MLEAMVKTLAKSVLDKPPAPEPEPEPPEATAPPAAPEPAPPVSDPAMPGLDLMSSFARMESIPYLHAEVGTAVIFPPKAPGSEQHSSEPAGAAAPDAAVGSEPLEEIAFEPPELAALRPPEPAAAEPFGVATPIRVATSTVSAVVVREQPPAPVAAPKPAEPQADPAHEADSMLFGPTDADPDPAAFLLGPAPVAVSPRTFSPALALPGPRVAITAAPPAPAVARTAAPAVAPAPPPRPRPKPAPPAAPYDPLAPLKTMSDEEKIALFS